jgi:hyperosmotically inducible periplasmic protein
MPYRDPRDPRPPRDPDTGLHDPAPDTVPGASAPTRTSAAPPPYRPATRFEPRRTRWPGILAAGVLGAAIAAVAVSSFYDDRSIGQKIDATVGAAQDSVARSAEAVASEGARGTERVATSLGDAGITAAVKAALVADPALSAIAIDVDTRDGVVALSGTAPDFKARERASVLAAAPQGVRGVENNLVVAGGAPVPQGS